MYPTKAFRFLRYVFTDTVNMCGRVCGIYVRLERGAIFFRRGVYLQTDIRNLWIHWQIFATHIRNLRVYLRTDIRNLRIHSAARPIGEKLRVDVRRVVTSAPFAR